MAWFTRPVAFFEGCRRRYGKRFTIRLPAQYPFVHLSDVQECKQVLTAPPEVLHPGEGARLLEPIVGANSVILLDEQPHLSQRRLLLPAFHGERIERLSDLVESVAEREVASWPRDTALRLQPRLQSVTLEIILRAVFGLDPGPRLDRLRELLSSMVDFVAGPLGSLPPLQRDLGGFSPWARFSRMSAEADDLIFELIDERRGEDEEREDVLAMLLAARHEDGSPMSPQELRDELLTMLVAGHETTASELSWAFSALSRSPAALAELRSEIADDDGDAYLTATINETLRRKPTLPIAEPRLVKEPYALGDWECPTDVCLAVNAYLVHHDPEVYPDPYAFRPERFLGREARHLHLPALRRRPAPLHRRELRGARDEGGAAGRAAREHAGADRRAGDRHPPGHHDQPGVRRRGDAAGGAGPGAGARHCLSRGGSYPSRR